MQPLPAFQMVLILLLGTTLAGCAGNNSGEPDDPSNEVSDAPTTDVQQGANRTHLADYLGGGLLVTDLTGRAVAGLCDQDIPTYGRLHNYWQIHNMPGQHVNENHTRLLFHFTVDNVFSDAGITGYRMGAFYDHELVFWTEPLKESAEFTYEFGGNMPDIDKDVRWTFFFKRTDPTTEDDEHACTAGHESGSMDIQIYAE